MSRRTTNPKRILAIDPTSRGFGYVVLEWPLVLVDWGVKSTRNEKEANTLSKMTTLIRHYQPECVVVQDCSGTGKLRCPRIQDLIDSIRRLATQKGIRSRKISSKTLIKVFSAFGARTKHEIAQVVAKQLPELAPHLPRYRKPWMSEDYWMAIFDAAALALTYFYSRSVRARKGPEP